MVPIWATSQSMGRPLTTYTEQEEKHMTLMSLNSIVSKINSIEIIPFQIMIKFNGLEKCWNWIWAVSNPQSVDLRDLMIMFY